MADKLQDLILDIPKNDKGRFKNGRCIIPFKKFCSLMVKPDQTAWMCRLVRLCTVGRPTLYSHLDIPKLLTDRSIEEIQHDSL